MILFSFEEILVMVIVYSHLFQLIVGNHFRLQHSTYKKISSSDYLLELFIFFDLKINQRNFLLFRFRIEFAEIAYFAKSEDCCLENRCKLLTDLGEELFSFSFSVLAMQDKHREGDVGEFITADDETRKWILRLYYSHDFILNSFDLGSLELSSEGQTREVCELRKVSYVLHNSFIKTVEFSLYQHPNHKAPKLNFRLFLFFCLKILQHPISIQSLTTLRLIV